MKTFKDFLTEAVQVDLKDLLDKDEVKKLEKHYGGNDGTKNIYQDIQKYKADHKAFINDPDKVADTIKKSMIKTSKLLRDIGKDDGVL